MSDKNRHLDDDQDLAIDFGAFEPEPVGGHGGAHGAAHGGHADGPDPFAFPGMPGPAPKPGRPAPSPRDHFGDLDGHDLAAPGHGEPPPEFGAFEEAPNFGLPDEEDEQDEAPPPRPVHKAAPRREERPARREPTFDDPAFGEPAFGGADDDRREPAHGGFDAGFEPEEPVRAPRRPGRAAAAFDAGDEHEHDEGREHDRGHGDDVGFDEGEHGDDPEEGEEEAAEGGRKLPFGLDRQKLIFPAATALVGAGILFAGWSYIGGMISGPQQPRAGGALTQVGGVERPAMRADGPSNPFQGNGPQGVGAHAPQGGGLPMPGRPMPVQPGAPALAQAPATAPGMPPMPAATPPVAAINLGQPSASAAAVRVDPALAERIDRLEAKAKAGDGEAAGVAELQQKVRLLEDRLAELDRRSVPPAPRPESTVPLKPPLVPGYTLTGYSRGTAWVQGPDGRTVEATVGTDLGSAGQVTGIQRYAKEFVVKTTVGVIMRTN